MDNHRAALWCWLQHIEQGDRVSICHIDKHSDVLSSQLDRWIRLLPDLMMPVGLNEYVPDPRAERDALIAATVLLHGMTVVTRNVSDFALTGVPTLNPWIAIQERIKE